MKKILYFLCALSLRLIGNQDPIGQDILLIINYNHAFYDSIEFIKEIYKPYFPNIVFYGPQNNPQVELSTHTKGYFSYKVFRQAMQKFPDYKGYFFVHDDCVINPWNFTRFDQSKIWLTELRVAELTPHGVPKWHWWPTHMGYTAIKKALELFPEKNKQVLQHNCGTNDAAMWGYSDIVYIPGSYKDEVISLCTILENQSVFLEIALPTLCASLGFKETMEFIKGDAIWDRRNPLDVYSTKTDYVHPIKFSKKPAREFIKNQFKLASNKSQQ
jgi:hypothetical protein